MKRAPLAAAALLAGCPGSIDDLAPYYDATTVVGDATVPVDAPACALDVEREILARRCGTAGCHAALDPLRDLDLASPGVRTRLANVRGVCRTMPLVLPGDPEASLLYQKVSQARPACGRRMPSETIPLPANEIACLRVWIATWSNHDAGVASDARGADR